MSLKAVLCMLDGANFQVEMSLPIMSTQTAVILAAGRGTRMNGVTGGRPKGFLPALGKTFASRTIDILRAEGISDIVVVTGFGAGFYDDLAAQYDGGVRTAYNPEFETTGTMQSLLAAPVGISGAFLVLDADIVYEARAVRSLVQSRADNAIVLSGIGALGDEFFAWSKVVEARGGRWLQHLSKVRADVSVPPDGEHMGIMKIGGALAAALRDWAHVNAAEAAQLPYELCLLHLLPQHPMQAVHIPDLIWTEVDTPAMFDHAQNVVLPKLAEIGD
jgi:choline kinase